MKKSLCSSFDEAEEISQISSKNWNERPKELLNSLLPLKVIQISKLALAV
jgi:hypothetical protein